MLELDKIKDPGLFKRGPDGHRQTQITEVIGLPFKHGAYTFGVELETCMSNFSFSQITGKPDGSISGPGRHTEFVSPILQGDKGIYFVAKMFNSIREYGAEVNTSTGFHVHVGGSACSIDPKKTDSQVNEFAACLINNFHNIQGWAFSINEDTSRSTRSYSRALSNKVEQNKSRLRYDSASSRNAIRFTQHSTIEFRSAQGTLDHEKAVAWVLCCLAQVSLACKLTEVTEPSQLLVFSPDINEFIKSKLNISITENATV